MAASINPPIYLIPPPLMSLPALDWMKQAQVSAIFQFEFDRNADEVERYRWIDEPRNGSQPGHLATFLDGIYGQHLLAKVIWYLTSVWTTEPSRRILPIPVSRPLWTC